MGKKRKFQDIAEVLARPWCYYCERDFDDLKILLSHQKARHFKCDRCGRRLNTAGGLSVHLTQVHKEQLNKVENAMPGREMLGIEIFGMEGIPDDVKAQYDEQRKKGYFEELQKRKEETGNPPPGSKEALEKRPSKFGDEDEAAFVQRFKDHVAKIEKGEMPESAATMEGVQPTYPPPPVAASPDPSQPPFGTPVYQQPPKGFPPGQAFPPQVPFPNGSPFGQGSFQPPIVAGVSGLPSRGGPGFPLPGQLPPGAPAANVLSSAVDDLISSAQAQAQAQAIPAVSEKKTKDTKTAKVHLVYSDNEISPEEKMAMRARYAYQPKA